MDTSSTTVDGTSRYYIAPDYPLRRMQDSRFIQGATATLDSSSSASASSTISGSDSTNTYTRETTSDSIILEGSVFTVNTIFDTFTETTETVSQFFSSFKAHFATLDSE